MFIERERDYNINIGRQRDKQFPLRRDGGALFSNDAPLLPTRSSILQTTLSTQS